MGRQIIRAKDIKEPVRIDKYLSSKFKNYSREYIKELCKRGFVKLNNNNVDADTKIKYDDNVEIVFPQRNEYILGSVEDLNILYEDEDLLIIDKPAGIKVHPAKKFDKDTTLIDILEKELSQKFSDWPLERPFLIHRLDKETSGVLLIAKKPDVQYLIAKQFKERKIKKIYRTIVCNNVEFKEGSISIPISKHKNISKVDKITGKDAITEFRRLSVVNKFSYLEIYPLTGRTHQIRTHLSFVGWPILGDKVYGGQTKVGEIYVNRVMLHSYSIEFLHPRRGIWKKYIAEIPEDFKFFVFQLSL
ncbi:MAG: RluA family pseudouridine synthase [Endomicrobia bacterium]|nr:RluA family pseudouridine synthase [Endomicrobiia bacterium]